MSKAITVKVQGVETRSDAASAAAGSGFVSLASLGYNAAEVDSLYGDIAKRSITPETFAYREYVTGLSDTVYTEHYICPTDGQIVVRFGINADYLTPASSSGAGAAAGGASRASGSRTTVSSRFIQTEVDKIVHEPAEIAAIEAASGYLFADVARKTVVVDILARENNTLQVLPSGKYEVHSVVLYKSDVVSADGKRDIFIIDPSNSKYSWHLANQEMQKIISASHPVQALVPFAKQLQIYKADGATGPAADQYRDCIDIAIKLAFGFNVSAEPLLISKLKEHPVILAVTNSDDIDKYFDVIKFHPIRVKQASDIRLVEKFCLLEELMLNKTKALSQLYNENRLPQGILAPDIVIAKRLDILKNDVSSDYSTFVQEIADFNTELSGGINSLLEGLDKLVG